jgi:hypothetical protein
MAATYTSLPVSIPSLMKAIVSEVEVNLTSDATLDIPRVSFKCETWIKLMERLSKESQISTFDEAKYPLVALLRNFDEKYKANTDLVEVSLTLVIVTPSTPTKESEDREVDNYTPILYPIYAELMSVLAESPYFLGYGISIEHTKTDNMHLGVDGTQGNTKYLLPDCVDGIIISGLKLGVVPSRCVGFNYGPSVQLTYLNNISDLDIYSNGDIITVTLSGAQYINTGFGSTPLYYLNVPTSSGYSQDYAIDIGEDITFQIDGLTDNSYIAYVWCDDGLTVSTLYFTFYVKGNQVVKYTPSVKYELTNFIVTGEEYTDYPFDVVHRCTYSSPNIQQIIVLSGGGNVQYDNQFVPFVQDTTEITTTILIEQPPVPAAVYYEVTVDGQNLTSQSFYKTN